MESALNLEGPGSATLVGILRKVPEAGNKLVLICHGVLGHKNYCFLPLLAEKLPFSSYRFDFRGNGDSDGQASYSRFEDDVEDLRVVHDSFERMGYNVIGVVGHSRGAWISLKYTVSQRPLGFVVNVASRYLMADGPKKHRPEELDHLEKEGYFMWQYRRKGRPASFKVTKADMDAFANADVSHIARIPPSTAVLTVHGLEDETIPPENAAYIANLVPNHTLRLLPGADHFFKNKSAQVVQIIVDWLNSNLPESRSVRMDRSHRSISFSRFIPLEGVTNCRDLGGYPTADGYVVRPRKVFRSGEMTGATAKDLTILTALGVHSLYDLRSEPEVKDRGNINLTGVNDLQRIFCPVFKDEDYSPEALAARWLFYTQGPEGFKQAYMMILEKGTEAFRRVFEALAHNSSGVILFHCTAGKDRTGLVAMLFLLLMGVEDEVICWDYEQTQLVLKRDKEQIDRIINMTQGKLTEEGARSMVSATFESMVSTLKAFRERWGNVDAYLDQIGINAATRKTLRDKYRCVASFL